MKKIIDRDYQDTHRTFSPLTKVKDAYVIFDTGYTIEEVSEMIINKFKETINE
jgi:cytidylate kinase